MSGVVTSATQQGYLPENERPACGNCYQHAESGGPLGCCKRGGFAVMADGWCPIWFPTEGWIREHRRSAAKLGIFLDKGPGAALEAAA